MKLIFKLTIFLFVFNISCFAHSIVLNAMDNEDGTMEVMGGYSTGASAQGAMLKIQSLSTLEYLYEKQLPESGSLIIKIPTEPYKIILEAGQGHIVEKDGDIVPQGGFTKEVKSFSNINVAFWTTLIISIFFLFLTLLISFFRYKNLKFKMQ